MPKFSRLVFVLAAVLASASLGGCSSKMPSDWGDLLAKTAEDGKRPAGKPVFDVVGQNLGNSQEVSLTPGELTARIAEREEADRWASASSWVTRHPEATLEVLRTLDPQVSHDTYLLMAEVHDAQTLVGGQAGWTKIAELRKRDSKAAKEYFEARKQLQARLAEGQVDRALELKLNELPLVRESVLLQIDAAQLRGTAMLLANRAAEAAAELSAAAESALSVSPYQAAYLLLLQSDAERRAGAGPAAAQTWQRAIVAAVKSLSAAPPVRDPVLWEKLGYLRPVKTPWPADVVGMLTTFDPLPGLATISSVAATTASDAGADPNEAEAVIWHSIGRWYLDRGHAQAGLVSFKRAESSVRSDVSQRWLRFRQAKALVQLDQNGPATAILAGLIREKQSELYRPAAALLGSIYMQRDQSRKGLLLLKQSVDREDGVEWPERSEAEADLALAYLTIGEAQIGMDRMHRAQRRFESEGNFESLALSLDNELRFLEHTGNRKDAAAVREKIRELEATR